MVSSDSDEQDEITSDSNPSEKRCGQLKEKGSLCRALFLCVSRCSLGAISPQCAAGTGMSCGHSGHPLSISDTFLLRTLKSTADWRVINLPLVNQMSILDHKEPSQKDHLELCTSASKD